MLVGIMEMNTAMELCESKNSRRNATIDFIEPNELLYSYDYKIAL